MAQGTWLPGAGSAVSLCDPDAEVRAGAAMGTGSPCPLHRHQKPQDALGRERTVNGDMPGAGWGWGGERETGSGIPEQPQEEWGAGEKGDLLHPGLPLPVEKGELWCLPRGVVVNVV